MIIFMCFRTYWKSEDDVGMAGLGGDADSHPYGSFTLNFTWFQSSFIFFRLSTLPLENYFLPCNNKELDWRKVSTMYIGVVNSNSFCSPSIFFLIHLLFFYESCLVHSLVDISFLWKLLQWFAAMSLYDQILSASAVWFCMRYISKWHLFQVLKSYRSSGGTALQLHPLGKVDQCISPLMKSSQEGEFFASFGWTKHNTFCIFFVSRSTGRKG